MSRHLRIQENRTRYARFYLRRFTEDERTFKNALDSYLQDQMKRVIEALDNTQKSIISEAFNVRFEIDEAKTRLLPVIRQILREAGELKKEELETEFDFYISNEVERTLDTRADLFSQSINETTFNQLKDQFKESLEEGENRQQLIRRIEQTYRGISKGRAQNIARTEVQVANQTGQFDAYKQAGITLKIWVSTPDDKTRPSHRALDGQEKPIEQPFDNGLMYPGDPSGSAGEIINCRCTI